MTKPARRRANTAKAAKSAKTPRRRAPAPPAPPPAPPPMTLDQETWRWALVATVGLTIIRLLVQRVSPLQLYPDEAQYWVWSRSLAFGYFSKPPLIAWIIAGTTAALGDAEPFVRAASPLLQGLAGLFVFAAGRKLYDPRIGLVGLLVYTLCPGVQIGSFVVSTDTPLCAGLAAALWLYAEIQTAQGRRRLFAAAGFGVALGLAFLAKYAAIYALIGVAAHLIALKDARRAWNWSAAALAILAFAVVVAPNLIWNATHGFATIADTAGEAAWNRHDLFNFAALGIFLGAQFGVFGPGPFAILVVGAVFLAWRRKLTAADALVLAWAAPPLIIVSVEAFISRANANWAAAAYAPGALLVAAWLVRWRAWRWTGVIVGGQALIAVVIIAGFVHPAFIDAVGASKALKGVRGWRELTAIIEERAQAESMAGPVSAVAVDSRYLYNEGLYYGRNYFGVEGAPPLRVWIAGRAPKNEAEVTAPLTVAIGQRVVAASWEGAETATMMKSFTTASDVQINAVGLDRKNSRRLDTFVGQGFVGRR